jgi:hypothetical protein
MNGNLIKGQSYSSLIIEIDMMPNKIQGYCTVHGTGVYVQVLQPFGKATG